MTMMVIMVMIGSYIDNEDEDINQIGDGGNDNNEVTILQLNNGDDDDMMIINNEKRYLFHLKGGTAGRKFRESHNVTEED